MLLLCFLSVCFVPSTALEWLENNVVKVIHIYFSIYLFFPPLKGQNGSFFAVSSELLFLSPPSELLHPIQLLEGDGVGAAGLRQDFSVCHSQLHRRALHGPGQRPAGGLTLGGAALRRGGAEAPREHGHLAAVTTLSAAVTTPPLRPPPPLPSLRPVCLLKGGGRRTLNQDDTCGMTDCGELFPNGTLMGYLQRVKFK